jgi:hypothetical protein
LHTCQLQILFPIPISPLNSRFQFPLINEPNQHVLRHFPKIPYLLCFSCHHYLSSYKVDISAEFKHFHFIVNLGFT